MIMLSIFGRAVGEKHKIARQLHLRCSTFSHPCEARAVVVDWKVG